MARRIIYRRVIWDGSGSPPIDPNGNDIDTVDKINADRIIPIEHLRSFRITVGSERDTANRLVINAAQITLQITNSSANGADEDLLVAIVDQITPIRVQKLYAY